MEELHEGESTRPRPRRLRRLFSCTFGNHADGRVALELELGAPAAKVRYCRDCGEEISRRALSGAEVCKVLKTHDWKTGADKIAGLVKDRVTGQLVEVRLVRRQVCQRCNEERSINVPPEEVPADVFERVENELRTRAQREALEEIDLDFGKDGDDENSRD